MGNVVVMVVVVMSVLIAGRPASGEDAPCLHPPCASGAVFDECVGACNAQHDACRKRIGAKQADRCASDTVQCKSACEEQTPAGTRGTSATSATSPLACVDACRTEYFGCVRRHSPKRPTPCEETSLRCQRGCPPVVVAGTEPPETIVKTVPPRVEAGPARLERPPRAEAGPARTAPGPPQVDPQASRPEPESPRVESAEPPRIEPAEAPRIESEASPRLDPAASDGSELTPAADASPESPRSATESARAAEPLPPDAPRSAPASGGDESAPERSAESGGVLHKARCLVDPSCAPAAPECATACGREYDACRELEGAKRGGDCATRLMRCRRDCAPPS